MDRAAVLAKTAKGLEEIRSRAHGVPQKLRTLLIMVDGTATVGETPLLRAELFRSVAANPYLRFFVAVDAPVELQVTWV
ncbi:MAG: thiosulfate oxidation carrier complex protein SoxZ, partial [Burkholderiales bacterium]|nr:thiosulfate oxidation carrier complex protein SoxZ [Burkholderiales bacterium]